MRFESLPFCGSRPFVGANVKVRDCGANEGRGPANETVKLAAKLTRGFVFMSESERCIGQQSERRQ